MMTTPARKETPGYRWGVASRHSSMIPLDGKPGWVTPGPPDYWFLTCGKTLKDAAPDRRFATRESAMEAARELNDAEARAPLDLSETDLLRRERLKRLGRTFSVAYGEGPEETRWPAHPGRYAVNTWSDRYGESFWETVDSLDDVERDADCVWDLDLDVEVPFTVTVNFDAAESRHDE